MHPLHNLLRPLVEVTRAFEASARKTSFTIFVSFCHGVHELLDEQLPNS